LVCSGHIGIGYSAIEKITNAVKNHPTHPKIILGGTLITSEPQLILKSLKPNFIVVGEGEITIIDLIESIENKSDPSRVDGIGFINAQGETILTKPRELIKDIDSIIFPDFELLGFKEFLDKQSNGANYCELDFPRSYPLLCSRGCPYQCTFCYHSIGIKYRERSLDDIFKEINLAIKKYQINSLTIHDDLLSLNKDRLYEFCKRIKEISKNLKGKIVWSCQVLVNTLDRELLFTLKDSGCNLISLGFESYSSIVLKSMKKPITPQEIDNAVKLAQEVQIGLQANFIFGDIAETKETARETLKYWKTSCNGQVQLGFIQPYPGSEIYDKCIKKGIIKDKLEFIKNNMAHTNWFNMTDNMSDNEIKDLKKEIVGQRWKHCKYIVPIKKIKRNSKRYNLIVKCPFCNETINYNNASIRNSLHYVIWMSCKKCHMRFYVSSRIYRFEMKHYEKLDFLRRNYLRITDNLLREEI